MTSSRGPGPQFANENAPDTEDAASEADISLAAASLSPQAPGDVSAETFPDWRACLARYNSVSIASP
jgi:hypothetical protein